MATIGLDNLFYSKITEDESGNETYEPPTKLAKAISADISVELNEASLYADDAECESIKAFKSGKLTLGIDDIGIDAAQDLTGASIDDNGVLVSTSDDLAPYVAVGFRAMRANGKYRYFWLYRVKFSIPSTSLATKGDSIAFQTPSIEGTVMRRNKIDGKGNHPWKTEVTEGNKGVSDETITSWFSSVYEPTFAKKK